MPTYLSFEERFWSKVNILSDDECWDWIGALGTIGYGQLTITKYENRKESLAHRIAWVLAFGPIHGKLEVGHKCANRKCVNPGHLYLTTRAENNREVHLRGEYKYPDQVEAVVLKAAQYHARYVRSLWEIRNVDLTTLPREKILQINGFIKDETQNHIAPVVEYKPPVLHIMPCGHDQKFAVHENEGTSWCFMCEYKILEEIVEKIRNLLELNDNNGNIGEATIAGYKSIQSKRRKLSETPPLLYLVN
jgi:hypothetical protein